MPYPIPLRYCFANEPHLMAGMAICNFCIGICFIGIAISILIELSRCHEDPNRVQLFMFRFGGRLFSYLGTFALFITSCGVSRLLEALTIWWPFYWPLICMMICTSIASCYALYLIIFK